MRLLFRAHAISSAFIRVVKTRFLCDRATRFDNANVPLDFVFQRLLDEAERVDVLDFGLDAKFLLSARSDADIGIATQRALFHVAVADAGIQNDLFQPRQVLVSFIRRPHVGFADDLRQGHARPV